MPFMFINLLSCHHYINNIRNNAYITICTIIFSFYLFKLFVQKPVMIMYNIFYSSTGLKTPEKHLVQCQYLVKWSHLIG